MKDTQWCSVWSKYTKTNSGGCIEHFTNYITYEKNGITLHHCVHTKAKQNNYNYCPDCGERKER